MVSGLAKPYFYNALEKIVNRDSLQEKTESLNLGRQWASYNSDWESNVMELFYRFYISLFSQFVKYWIDSKPKSIMEFGDVKRKFEKRIVKKLASSHYALTNELLPDPVPEPVLDNDEDVMRDQNEVEQPEYY